MPSSAVDEARRETVVEAEQPAEITGAAAAAEPNVITSEGDDQ